MKSFHYDRDFAVVDTTAGKIRGFEHDGILTFRGVRYATAKRFHAPEPIPYQEGVTDAISSMISFVASSRMTTWSESHRTGRETCSWISSPKAR